MAHGLALRPLLWEPLPEIYKLWNVFTFKSVQKSFYNFTFFINGFFCTCRHRRAAPCLVKNNFTKTFLNMKCLCIILFSGPDWNPKWARFDPRAVYLTPRFYLISSCRYILFLLKNVNKPSVDIHFHNYFRLPRGNNDGPTIQPVTDSKSLMPTIQSFMSTNLSKQQQQKIQL